MARHCRVQRHALVLEETAPYTASRNRVVDDRRVSSRFCMPEVGQMLMGLKSKLPAICSQNCGGRNERRGTTEEDEGRLAPWYLPGFAVLRALTGSRTADQESIAGNQKFDARSDTIRTVGRMPAEFRTSSTLENQTRCRMDEVAKSGGSVLMLCVVRWSHVAMNFLYPPPPVDHRVVVIEMYILTRCRVPPALLLRN